MTTITTLHKPSIFGLAPILLDRTDLIQTVYQFVPLSVYHYSSCLHSKHIQHYYIIKLSTWNK